jgi:hypothetical protein
VSGALDWLGRVVMLAVAGLVTLSIIGAIAALPSGSGPLSDVEIVGGDQPVSTPAAPAEEALPEPSARFDDASPAGEERPVLPPTAEREPETGPWLETIAYTLLALVGLAALGLVQLWRAARSWRRIADALESRS